MLLAVFRCRVPCHVLTNFIFCVPGTTKVAPGGMAGRSFRVQRTGPGPIHSKKVFVCSVQLCTIVLTCRSVRAADSFKASCGILKLVWSKTQTL